MKYSIQYLESYDYQDTLCMCDKALEMGPYAQYSDNVASPIAYLVKDIIDGKNEGFALGLFTESNVLVGILIGLYNSNHEVLGRAVASEIVWYVDKKHRGSHTLDMLKEFEAWSIETVGADLITMSQFLGIEEERGLKVLYKRKGYTPMEVSYIKEC